MRHNLICLLVLATSLLAGCPGPSTPIGPAKAKPSAVPEPVAAFRTGRVLDVAGTPVAGQLVRGYIISDVGAGLVGIVRVPVVSNGGGRIVGNNAGSYALAQAEAEALTATTAADGSFTLKAPAGSHLNLEAAKNDDLKAFQPDVAPDAHDLTLQLAPTGTIAGTVKASAASVTKLLGVDVFIPGSSYVAKTAEDGHYTLEHVPVGVFPLVASKAGLGQAIVKDVKVTSRQTTTAPDLVLAVVPPTIATVTPANGPVGTAVTLTGEQFGAAAGDLLEVKFAGTPAIKPERVDDHTIKAVVPEGAVTGSLQVTVGGIPSNAVRFQVVKSIGIPNDRPDLPLDLLVNGSRTLVPVVLDTDSKPVDQPVLTWTAEGGASVDAAGKVTGRAAGPGQVTVHAGSLTASVQLEVASALAAIQAFGAIPDRSVADSLAGPVIDAEGGVWLMLTPAAFAAGSAANQRLYRLAPGAAAPVAAGPALTGQTNRIGSDGQGRVLVATTTKLLRFGADGKAVELPGSGNPALASPMAITGDAAGNVYVFDDLIPQPIVTFPGKVHVVLSKVDPAGNVTTVAGSERGYLDAKGAAARFYSPKALAVDAAGAIYLADRLAIRKIAADGTATTIAGTPPEPGVNDDPFFVPQTAPATQVDATGTAATFLNPVALTIEPGTGALLVADSGNLRRVVPATGAVTTAFGGGASEVKATTTEQLVAPDLVHAFLFGVAVAKDGTPWALSQDGPVRVKLTGG